MSEKTDILSVACEVIVNYADIPSYRKIRNLAQAVIDLSAALEAAPKIPDQAWNPDRMADFIDTYSNWYLEVACAALAGKDLGGLVKGGA